MQAIPQPAAQSGVQKVSEGQPQTTKDKLIHWSWAILPGCIPICCFCSSSKLGEISKLSRSVRMTTGLSIRQFHWVNPFNVRVFHQQRVLPLHWPMGPKQSSFLSDFRPEVTDFCPEVIPCSSGRTLKTCYYDCLSDSLALARACVCVRACVRVVLERILTLDNRNTKLL